MNWLTWMARVALRKQRDGWKTYLAVLIAILFYSVIEVGLASADDRVPSNAMASDAFLAFTRSSGNAGTIVLAKEAGAGFDILGVLTTRDLRVAPAVPGDKPTIFPSGEAMAYTGFLGTRSTAIYYVATDGRRLHQIAGTAGGSHPVLSPNGQTLAFARSRLRVSLSRYPHVVAGTSIWTLDLRSHRQKQLIGWHAGRTVLPTTFSPDGRLLAVSETARRNAQIKVLNLRQSTSTVIANDAGEAMFSPDGSHIAFVKHRGRGQDKRRNQSFIYIAHSDGKDARELLSEGSLDSSPAWDPSGERLAFIRTTLATQHQASVNMSLMEVNADGTCVTEVRSFSSLPSSVIGGISGPIWQPSTAAGRINCG